MYIYIVCTQHHHAMGNIPIPMYITCVCYSVCCSMCCRACCRVCCRVCCSMCCSVCYSVCRTMVAVRGQYSETHVHNNTDHSHLQLFLYKL